MMAHTPMVKLFVAMSVTLLVLSFAAQAQAQQKYYLPILRAGDAGELGLALSNPALAEATVTLTARNYAGETISGAGITNPARITVPALGQRALQGSEIFGSGIAGKTGWVELQASSLAVKGFFLVFDSRLTFIDGAELQTTPGARLIFPKVSAAANSSTTISFVHTGSGVARLAAVSLYDNSGRLVARELLDLQPRSGFSGPITDLLPDAAGSEGYVVVETTGTPFSGSDTLVGFETYRNRSDIAALNAIPETARLRTGYLPHLASQAGFTTTLALVNYGSQAQTVRITAAGLESSGTARTPASVTVERTIPAYGRLEETAGGLFNLSGTALITGYITWETQGMTGGVIGYLDYGTVDGVLLSAVPAQASGYSELFFSHVAEGLGFYTGLAFLNTNTQGVTINLETFDREGRSTGKAVFTLAAGERRSRLLRELISNLGTQSGGYVRVTATRPVFAFQLFGSATTPNFLANVSAQGVQLQTQLSGRTVSATAGATVISRDTLSTISIPPGALAADTAISLRAPAVTLPAPSATQRVVAAIDAQPSGTRFQIPVRLTLPLAAQLEAGTEIPVLIFDSSTQSFEDSGFKALVDETGRTASALVTHFTIFALPVSTDRLLTVTSVSPASGIVGATVTISGTGFSPTAANNIVTFAGPDNTVVRAEVTAASEISLTAQVPAGSITGNLIVRVGTKTSIGLLFTVEVDKFRPMLSSITPSRVGAGLTTVEIELKGANFHPSSVVLVDGAAVTSTFEDSTSMSATLPASQLTPGIRRITVFSPPPGGGESAAKEFTVGFPVPVITSISPAEGNARELIGITITGTGFVSGIKVRLDEETVMPPTFVSSTTLTATIFSVVGMTRLISVVNPAPGGGQSNAVGFRFKEVARRPPVGSIVLITPTGQSAVVASQVQLTVEVQSTGGGIIGAQSVAFAVTAGNGSVTSSATTGNDGRATVTVTLGTTAGLNRVAASAGTVVTNFDVTGTPGPAAKVGMSASPSSFAASTTAGSTISARIEDQYGNLRTDSTASVTFSLTTGSGTLSAASAKASGGIASVTFISTAVGVNTITGASSGLTSGTVNVTVTVGAPASMSATDGIDQTGQAGVALSTALRVQVKDAFGNNVPGITVTFSVVSGGGSVSPTSATTSSSGQASTTATPGGSLGTQTFRAAATGVTSVDFNATISHGPASQLAIAAASTSVQANVTTNLTVTVKDQFGNTATSATNTLTLAASPTSSVTFGSTSPALSQGVATTTFKATTATSYTVTVTSGTLTSANVGITVTAAAASSLVSVSGAGQSGVKGSDLSAPLVVKVTDAFDNGVSGVTVTFEALSGNGSTVTPTSQATGSNGQASTTAKLGTVTGSYTFRATASGLTGSPVQFTATATEEAPSSVVQISSHASATVATTQTFTVEVRGASGSVVPQVNVTFSRTAGDGKIDGGTADVVKATGSDGRASVTLTLGNTAGTNTFKATVSGVTPVTLSVTGTAGTATQLVKITADQTGAVGTQLSNALIVEARDQFNNPKSGVSVTFAVASGAGATVSSTSAQTTGSDGRASVTATLGTATGTYTFTATSTGLTGSPVTFTATATQAATKIELVSGNAQTVAPGISLLTPLKVKVTDANNVGVPNVTVNWAVASGGGSVSASTSTTNSSGEAQITATVGSTAGTNTFTAAVTGLTGSPVTFTATSKTLTSTPASVDVQISSGSVGVGSFQVTINFDATKLQVSASNVVVGTGAGYQLVAINPDNTAGTLIVNGFSTSAPAGSYTVARVTFTPIRPGSVTLTTSGIDVTDVNGNAVSTSFLSLSATSLTVN